MGRGGISPGPRCIRSCRGAVPGAALVAAALAACGGPDVQGTPRTDWTPPVVRDSAGARWIENSGPRLDLTVGAGAPAGDLELLFVDGRAVTPLASGRTGWADLAGGRGLVFDPSGSVERVLQGVPAEGPPLNRPAFVLDRAHGAGWSVVETDGRALQFDVDGGEPVWDEPAGPGVAVARRGGRTLSARTVLEFDMVPVRPGDPVVWMDRDGESPMGVGRAVRGDEPLLGQLTNAGWAALRDDGSVLFAAATRPEISAYSADGTLLWRATHPLPISVPSPRFELVDGDLHPRFRAVQHGLAVDRRGRAYVLADVDGAEGAEELRVFDRDGTLLGSARTEPGGVWARGREGGLWRFPVPTLLARTPESAARPTFASFSLPRVDGSGPLRLDDLTAPVVVVNVWASWCTPCRREIPLLSAYAARVPSDSVQVVGLNDDLRPEDAVGFLRELEASVSYPSGLGEGRLRGAYGYRGLPWTVVLDRDRRVVGSVYGFGSSVDPITRLVEEATDASASDVGGATDGSVTPPD